MSNMLLPKKYNDILTRKYRISPLECDHLKPEIISP